MFSSDALSKRLDALDGTQLAIENLSAWLLYHKKKAPKAAATWLDYVTSDETHVSKLLPALYILNDVLQKSLGKYPGIVEAFQPLIVQALVGVSKRFGAGDPIHAKITRLLGIWRDRSVLSSAVLAEARQALDAVKRDDASSPSTTTAAAVLDDEDDADDGGPASPPAEQQDVLAGGNHPLFRELSIYVEEVDAWVMAEAMLRSQGSGSDEHMQCIDSLNESRDALAVAFEAMAEQQRSLKIDKANIAGNQTKKRKVEDQ